MYLPVDIWSVIVTMNHSTTVSSTCKELQDLRILLTCPGCHRISDAPLCSRCGCKRQSKLQKTLQNAAYSFNRAGIDRHCRKELLEAMKKRKIDAIYVKDVENKMKRTSKAVKRLKSFEENKKDDDDEFCMF